MNLLFVCSMNKWRSPTAEAIFKNHHLYHAKSAGVCESARIKLTKKMIDWADLIFVMEKNHKQRLLKLYPSAYSNKEIIVLEIADDYQFMDPELIEIIKQSVVPYLNDL